MNIPTFDTMREAIDALSRYEELNTDTNLYEINAVFSTDRQPIGYQVRVKDLDGYGIGYVFPAAV